MRAGAKNAFGAGLIALVGVGLIACITPLGAWLSRPWDDAPHPGLPAWMAWHGRLMVLGWAILAPAGVLAARYCKIWPGQDWPRELDDQHWWHAHRLLQTGAIMAASAGLLLAWRNAAGLSPLARAHGLLGWAIMGLGWAQIVGGLLRGAKGGPTDPRCASGDLSGDHYSMTSRRIVFEYAHKLGGYVVLGLSVVAVAMGLRLADAPRWMWLVIVLWWIALAGVATACQRAGLCIDTYQAIWGPDGALPGNRRRPIGWGVSRPLRHPFKGGD